LSEERRRLGYRWKLKERMWEKGMSSAAELAPLLEERGVKLSYTQVYRLVAQKPERLNLRILVALCDALGCTPNDLVEPAAEEEAAPAKKAAGGGAVEEGPRGSRRPKRARVVDDDAS
jgi:DNA-binding Xre family transcriptional regulator